MAKSFGRRAQKFLFLVNYPDFLFLIDKKADQFDTRVTTKLVNRGPLIPLVRKIWQFLDFFVNLFSAQVFDNIIMSFGIILGPL